MRRCRLIRSALVSIVMVAVAGTAAHAQTGSSDPSAPSTDAGTPPAASIPFVGVSPELTVIHGDLDAATKRAFELEKEIDALEADNRAITERLAVTAERLVLQQAAVDAAEDRFEEAERRYRGRLVEVYKRGSIDPFTLLLSSETVAELVSRAAILTRIAANDSQVVSDLNVAAADARYQEAQLTDLQLQDRTLKREQETRLASLSAMLAEQEKIVSQLTVEAREALLQTRRFTAETRQQWRLSSTPIGVPIPRANATVDSHPDLTYLVSAYMPRQYHSTGQNYLAVCSWYGPGFNGRGTASGQVFNEDDFTCASRTLPFGTVLALTRADRRIIVYVNDRGPYIDGRDLDLSKAAAQALGFGGVATVQVEVVTAIQ